MLMSAITEGEPAPAPVPESPLLAGDLPEVERIPFHFFARSTAVSHAYAHIVEVGGEVNVGGLAVKSGDLLMGDRHGVLSVPAEIAAQIPRAAKEAAEKERALVQLCRSSDFTVQKLRAALQQ